MPYSKESLKIDAEREVDRIVTQMRQTIFKEFKRKGGVVGVSGGIDSSVVLALCARAFGPERVLAVLMPEAESSPDNIGLTRKLIAKVGVAHVIENMTPALFGFGCYQRRDAAIKRIFPEYDESYRTKIVLPKGLLEAGTLNFFQLTVISPEGEEKTTRLPLKEYLEIVAASNFKQRSRMSMLYYHAEIRNYGVIGTPNKNEHDLGFFVKFGDSGVDIKPIVHLFKSQVYQLAAHLEIPEEICQRIPTSDTYSAEQTQEEFFFRIPFDLLDLIWCGWEAGAPEEEIARAADLKAEQVRIIIDDIKRKKSTTQYLRTNPIEIGA
ncbi:MAG: NAD(+) synthase [Myxococcota bacterium]|nr:NAD(+) synthase [Myxococcota bacterium]